MSDSDIKESLRNALLMFFRPTFRLFPSIQSININGHSGIGNLFGKDFKSYFITENMPVKIERLKSGLDQKSLEIVDRKLEHFLQLPQGHTKYAQLIRCYDRDAILYTPEELKEKREFKAAISRIREELIGFKNYLPEVVYYHHGLKRAPPAVLKYIEGGTFVDCGAAFGDSATVLAKYYGPKKLISFEMTGDPAGAKQSYVKTLLLNNLEISRFVFVPEGVSDVNTSGEVPMTTLDTALAGEPDIKFIKMDIEGAALMAVKGALDVIEKNRPVMVISIYHTPNEFFEIKPLIESLNLDYKFMIRNLNFTHNFELETVLICYPSELG